MAEKVVKYNRWRFNIKDHEARNAKPTPILLILVSVLLGPIICTAIFIYENFKYYYYSNSKLSLYVESHIAMVLASIIMILQILITLAIRRLERDHDKGNQPDTGKYRSLNANNRSLKIIFVWSSIELIAVRVMQEKGYNSRDIAIPLIIDFLEKELPTPDHINMLHEILSIRNKIVHHHYDPRPVDIKRFYNFSMEIMNALKTRLDNPLFSIQG